MSDSKKGPMWRLPAGSNEKKSKGNTSIIIFYRKNTLL